MIFVDTSFLLAILDPRDGLHSTARACAARAEGPMLITEHVLWEVLNFVSATPSRSKGEVLVNEVIKSAQFEVVFASRELFDRAFALFSRRPDKAWSLTDCVSFVVMGERGVTEALTGDRHFEQAGFRALTRGE
jgi:predicted nucleic acid-binding protein